MSLFGKIASLEEIVARLPQFQIQVEKLEEEEHQLGRGGSRGSFVKRCQELGRQISEQRQRVDTTRGNESTRAAAIMSLDDLQRRLYTMAPERASTSRSSVNSSEVLREDDAPPTSSDNPGLRATRRPSMYDDYQSSSDDEGVGKNALPPLNEEEPGGTPPTPAPRKVELTSGSSSAQGQRASRTRNESQRSSFEENDSVIRPPRSTSPGVVEGNRFKVLADLESQERGDLAIRKGQVLKIVMTRPDGWWKAVNEKGEEGMVPKTYLQHVVPEELEEIAPLPVRREERGRQDSEEQKRIEREKEKLEEDRRVIEEARRQLEADRRTQQREMLRQVEEERERFKEEHMQSLMNRRQPQIEESIPPPRPAMKQALAVPLKVPVTCLGDALRADPHLTFQCHLTPRLSHSNLAFHDLFWNYETDRLRKRRVTVSKVIHLVRLESMPTVEFGLIRAALYDQSKKTGRQIVSNVHTVRAQIKNGTWSFIARTDTVSAGVEFGDFIVRSNYRMVDVVLLLEAAVVEQFQNGFRERTVGIVKIPIMGHNGETCLINKTYSDYLLDENIFQRGSDVKKTNSRIWFKVTNVPNDLVSYVDSLPDVLVFNPMHIRLMYFYRRRAGTLLIRDKDNPMNAEMISDPLLAVFPAIADQADLMDLLRTMWTSKKPEKEQAMDFFQVFMNTAFCIHKTAILPEYNVWDKAGLAERQKAFRKCIEMHREYKSAARYLLTVTSQPINIYDYSFNLLGPHALD